MAEQYTPTVREMYPHREVGIAVLILGVLLIVLAAVLGGYCGPVNSGPGIAPGPGCAYTYAGSAALLGLTGLVLIIVGLVFVTQRNPATMPALGYPASGWAQPQYYLPPPPPPPPMVACKSCGRVHTAGHYAFCPDCGSKLGP